MYDGNGAGWLELGMERRDTHRAVTIVSAAGLTAAVAMAVFGLPSVDLHGPLHQIGIMSPTCGATRAAWFTARGDLALAWTYNPLGILAVAAAALAVARTVMGLATTRWVRWAVTTTPWKRRVLYLAALTLVLALEVRQQSRAGLLMGA